MPNESSVPSRQIILPATHCKDIVQVGHEVNITIRVQGGSGDNSNGLPLYKQRLAAERGS